MGTRRWSLLVAGALALATPARLRADEITATDKLRMLYSSRFNFSDEGVPVITIEIASGDKTATLSAPGGLRILPDGAGGSRLENRKALAVTVRAQDTSASIVDWWTVVATLEAGDEMGLGKAMAAWQARGLAPKSFETGTIVSVQGEVIDTRRIVVAVSPVREASLQARVAADVSKKFGVTTSAYQELVKRPGGEIVASLGDAEITNGSILWFEPVRDGETIAVANVKVGHGGSQLTSRRETRRYWGRIFVTVGHDGSLVVVNAVPEDKLLAGIVPAEMFADAPLAALEAQAIAARTDLLDKVTRRSSVDPFLLCSTQACQVYAGAGHETAQATQAVANTRGMVMLRNGGGLVDARYSSSCGGHGEHNDTIWGGAADPSLRGGFDVASRPAAGVGDVAAFLKRGDTTSWCARGSRGKEHVRWSKTFAAAELSKMVAAKYPQVGAVRKLEPLERGVSGRLRRLRVVGEGGSAIVEGDLTIRRLFGGLKSSLFVVAVTGPAAAPQTFTFNGAGFGHGVGMCQVGASAMAEAGKTHQEILSHYYRGMHLHRLY
ncbi:MAG: SpoIID/LytB domain-containing protein [Myxococcales bacterium]|nr:SpoIID/LytB domain-containing protein [Myxococcales bacterium]